MDEKTIERVRAAIKDRAVWFALLYGEFEKEFGEARTEALARKAVKEYGRRKGRSDGERMGPAELMAKFEATGGAELFSAIITEREDHIENRVGYCALVEAWREMGLAGGRIDLYCDIAMEGDRGRAEYHGLRLDLGETLGKGDEFCRIRLEKRKKENN